MFLVKELTFRSSLLGFRINTLLKWTGAVHTCQASLQAGIIIWHFTVLIFYNHKGLEKIFKLNLWFWNIKVSAQKAVANWLIFSPAKDFCCLPVYVCKTIAALIQSLLRSMVVFSLNPISFVSDTYTSSSQCYKIHRHSSYVSHFYRVLFSLASLTSFLNVFAFFYKLQIKPMQQTSHLN